MNAARRGDGPSGAICIVLHAHQPYVRRHGTWPCGEDWFHQAAVDAYLPLAEACRELAGDGLRGFLTISVSPTLGSQMADPYLSRELALYLGRMQLAAERMASNDRGERRDLAAWYHRRAARLGDAVLGMDGLHRPWAALADDGAVEVITAPAGHPFVPLLRSEGLARGRFQAASDEHARLFGRRPRAFWLPELGYRPPGDGTAGTETLVERAGGDAMVVDGTAFPASVPDRPALVEGSDVMALARDEELSGLLTSGIGGASGAGWYRDFHHHDADTGLRPCRTTGVDVPFAGKRPYDPRAGTRVAREEGRRFAQQAERTMADRRARNGRPGVAVLPFDAELFGHWWFEGPLFMAAAIRELAERGSVRALTVSAALETFPPEEKVTLRASSWGRGHDDSVWRAPATEPVWQRVREGERTLERALAHGGNRRTLAQAAREYLLLSASDWPYMITQGRAGDYGRERLAEHGEALRSLCAAIGRAEIPPRLAELEERDNLLPTLDPAAFGDGSG